jgi:hypothetical protein
MAFAECAALTEVRFASDSRLRVIDGFLRCASLIQLEIPASVEEIRSSAFKECSELAEVIFPIDSRLRSLSGFRVCNSLHSLKIPASVEKIDCSARHPIGASGVSGGSLGRELIFQSTAQIKTLPWATGFQAFLTFADDDDLKKRRRGLHLRTSGFESRTDLRT